MSRRHSNTPTTVPRCGTVLAPRRGTASMPRLRAATEPCRGTASAARRESSFAKEERFGGQVRVAGRRGTRSLSAGGRSANRSFSADEPPFPTTQIHLSLVHRRHCPTTPRTQWAPSQLVVHSWTQRARARPTCCTGGAMYPRSSLRPPNRQSATMPEASTSTYVYSKFRCSRLSTHVWRASPWRPRPHPRRHRRGRSSDSR